MGPMLKSKGNKLMFFVIENEDEAEDEDERRVDDTKE